MLPTFIAFKKEQRNQYLICEAVRQGVAEGLSIYKLVPKANNTFQVTNLEHYNNRENHSVIIKRITRNVPYFRHMTVGMLEYGANIEMEYNNEIYFVPVMRTNNLSNCLGHRWEENNADYLFSWDLDNRDADNLRNIMTSQTDRNIVSFTGNGRFTIPIRVQNRNELSRPQTIPMPNMVIRGWLLNSIRDNGQCPITFDNLTETTTCYTPCWHIMSYSAASTWFENNSTCPVCREQCSLDSVVRFESISS